MALVQNGDLAGDLPHKGHVVFNHNDAVLAFEAQQQFAGAVGFLIGHAGRRFVHEQELRILRQEHADLQPLLLAVGEGAGQHFGLGREADRFQHRLDAVALFGGGAGKQRGEDAARAFEREQQIFKHRVVNVHGRRLKLAADAEPVDLWLVHQRKIGIQPELHLAGVRLGATGDDVHHGAFAGAIRANDGAQLALIHVEIQVRDGLESVKRLVNPFERQNELFECHGHSGLAGWTASSATGTAGSSAIFLGVNFCQMALNCAGRPTMPLGMKMVTRMNVVPRKISQRSG